MNVNSFQDRENATLDQALPSNRPSITKQLTKHDQEIDQALPSDRPSIFFQVFSPNIFIKHFNLYSLARKFEK